MEKLQPGLSAEITTVVDDSLVVKHVGGDGVLSTPAMIGLMEVAAAQAVQDSLPPGAITVGTRIEVDHLKAVPAGAHVRASARLAKISGRFLVFEVDARSGSQVIGRGRVFRAVVEHGDFAAKAAARGKT